MSDQINKQDQAISFRRQVRANYKHHLKKSEMPPRREVHKRRKRKRVLKFPLVKILLILFFLLIATILTLPHWFF